MNIDDMRHTLSEVKTALVSKTNTSQRSLETYGVSAADIPDFIEDTIGLSASDNLEPDLWELSEELDQVYETHILGEYKARELLALIVRIEAGLDRL